MFLLPVSYIKSFIVSTKYLCSFYYDYTSLNVFT